MNINTCNIKKASQLASLILLPLAALSGFLFFHVWKIEAKAQLSGIKTILNISDKVLLNQLILFVVIITIALLGILIHELIHGLMILALSKNGLHALNFGFNKTYWIPYTHCREPIQAYRGILIALMPGILLGFLPLIYAHLYGKVVFWWYGVLFTLFSMGDLVYVALLLKNARLRDLIQDLDGELGFRILDKPTPRSL